MLNFCYLSNFYTYALPSPFFVPLKEATNVCDVQNIKHISEDKKLLGDDVEKIADDWRAQKETFYGQTGMGEDEGYGQALEHLLLKQQQDDEE